MEPNWTKQISSETVCNFFYVFFVIYAGIFVLSLLGTVGLFAYAKKLGGAGVALGLQGVVVTLIGATMMLFYYLICDRALLAKGAAAAAKEGFEAQRRQPY
jgi:hypothetical protein